VPAARIRLHVSSGRRSFRPGSLGGWQTRAHVSTHRTPATTRPGRRTAVRAFFSRASRGPRESRRAGRWSRGWSH